MMRLQRVPPRSMAGGTRAGCAGDADILGAVSTFEVGGLAGATTGGAALLVPASFAGRAVATGLGSSGLGVIEGGRDSTCSGCFRGRRWRDRPPLPALGTATDRARQPAFDGRGGSFVIPS